MKRYLNILFLLLLVAITACSEQGQTHEHAEGTTYTCPMHPQIVQNQPGSCPICGMDLVPQNAAHGEALEITDDLEFLLQPTNQAVIANIRTVTPAFNSQTDTMEMEGLITYDDRRVYSIPARVSGRIEKLFVKYNYQSIYKGQKLLEIYSPELVTAQKELLYLAKSASEDKALIEAAKQKLRLLGATDAQLNRLLRTGEASYTFAIHSPYDGYVVGLNTTAPAAKPATMPVSASKNSGMEGSMTQSAPSPGLNSTASDLPLREGMYVNTGQPLLRVINPDQLWAEFNVPAGKVTAVAKGAPVQITFPQLPGELLEAKVDFLQPFYEAGESFAKIRVYLPGQQKLARVGQLVSAKATYATKPTLWVPREAVLDLGTKAVAFKKVNGSFKPVAVTTNQVIGNQIQVISGLTQTDTISGNAQFMVDSESFVKVNFE
ncbi:efflux RND transporter periplasmic adaptor subunit [Pontibacter oryzae]|uniref:Efflux RND transporter periplasmic adaptor subunit n=1 Tax=Pontibacter oryzae TaxID=2304593 RepID=A0A399RR58_9BACT|nr:efflux RND transporter periplasmic adaptor subunit [Pontibacter oryzae]RIJ34330.1 efflux RND transporter periplasmic adaptor subunit [Pontibacter oryzae]